MEQGLACFSEVTSRSTLDDGDKLRRFHLEDCLARIPRIRGRAVVCKDMSSMLVKGREGAHDVSHGPWMILWRMFLKSY